MCEKANPQLGREEFRVPTETLGDCRDGVLQLLALIAYPSASEKPNRDPFAMALHATIARGRVWTPGKNKHDGVAFRTLLPLADRKMRPQRIRGLLGNGSKRLRHRLIAADIAVRLYTDGWRIPYQTPTDRGTIGVEIRGPLDMKGALKGVVKTKEEVLNLHRDEDYAAENEYKQMWLPSLPVLHLCIVLWWELNKFPDGTPNEAMIGTLVDEPQWLHAVLLKGEGLRMTLHEKIRDFDPEKAIRFLPEKPACILPK